jgi:hypothetical protein
MQAREDRGRQILTDPGIEIDLVFLDECHEGS